MPHQEDRDLVVAYLHHSGAHAESLPDDDMWEVYCLGDGFGKLPPEELSQINEGWDWSHVRDSSEGAFADMAGYLRTRGYTIEGPPARPAP